MAHRLFIVARGDDHLYEELRQQFAANPEVEVLVDRRHAERRRDQTLYDPERRRGDRPNAVVADRIRRGVHDHRERSS